MASGDLVRDPQSNLIVSGHRTAGKAREYEFAFPMKNESLGNTAWERDRSYQIAVLVGPAREFKRVEGETWMSDQVLIRIATASTTSIYHPSPPPDTKTPEDAGHEH